MFARIIAAAALSVALAVPAWADSAADTDVSVALAPTYQSMSKAGADLRARAASLQSGKATSDALMTQLSEFAQTAAAAGAAIDANAGPHDLGCIYRGMAEDAGRQARRLNEGAEVEDAVETVRLLGNDAVLVTPETKAEMAQTADPTGIDMGTCPLAEISADQLAAYFTEQP